MNILPFIFSFLIIFALIFNYASDRRESTALYRLALNRWLQSVHQGFTKHATTEFKRATHKNPSPESEKNPQKEAAPIDEDNDEISFYFRESKCHYEENKLNLMAFEAPEVSSQDFQYKVGVKLIKALYERAPFYEEGLEYQVVNALLTREKKPLRDLFQNDPHLDAIFYKMLKGTTTYAIGTNQGYPALTDYCSFKETDSSLHFPYLSKPVLEALLGSSLMKTIEKSERENNKALTEKTFTPLLEAASSTDIDKAYLKKVLKFGKTKKGNQTASVDNNNEMIIR